MIGKGKYDDLCTAAREGAQAAGAIVIIIGGNRGSGFSVQGPMELTPALPGLLRETAKNIEDSFVTERTSAVKN